jgi:tetratricopeptide (TPR) repeat protein
MSRALWSLLLSLLFLAPSPTQAQDYRSLWREGLYQQALLVLEEQLDQYRGTGLFTRYAEYADLLAHVGRHDEAIALLQTITASYPLPSFAARLAHRYHYRGRRDEYQELLAQTARQIETLRGYRLDREEQLAIVRLLDMRGEDPQTILRQCERLASAHPDYARVRVAAGRRPGVGAPNRRPAVRLR